MSTIPQTAPDDREERYGTLVEGSALLAQHGIDISPRSLGRMADRGEIDAYRAGQRKIFIRLDNLVDCTLTPVSLRDAVDEFVDDLVARAPDLTPEQRDRLLVLLKDGAAEHGDAA